MKTCFSAGKLMKLFGNPPFLKEPSLFLSNFFMTPLFVQILKPRTPPPAPPNFRRTHYGFNCVKSVQQVTAT